MRSTVLATLACAAPLSHAVTAKADPPKAEPSAEELRWTNEPPDPTATWRTREKVSTGFFGAGVILTFGAAPILGLLAASTRGSVSDGFLDASLACVGVAQPLWIGGAIGYQDARAHLAAFQASGPALAVTPYASRGTGGLALRVAF